MFRILIAEDEEPIANLIRMNLTRAVSVYLGAGWEKCGRSYGTGKI